MYADTETLLVSSNFTSREDGAVVPFTVNSANLSIDPLVREGSVLEAMY